MYVEVDTMFFAGVVAIIWVAYSIRTEITRKKLIDESRKTVNDFRKKYDLDE